MVITDRNDLDDHPEVRAGQMDEDEKPRIDDEIADLTEDEALGEKEPLKRKWVSNEAVDGVPSRLLLAAVDLVQHYEDPVQALDGKALIVSMIRRICVAFYDEIVKLRPYWHSAADKGGAIKTVMTGSVADFPERQPSGEHRGRQAPPGFARQAGASPQGPLRLVIVRYKWLTGASCARMALRRTYRTPQCSSSCSRRRCTPSGGCSDVAIAPADGIPGWRGGGSRRCRRRVRTPCPIHPRGPTPHPVGAG